MENLETSDPRAHTPNIKSELQNLGIIYAKISAE